MLSKTNGLSSVSMGGASSPGPRVPSPQVHCRARWALTSASSLALMVALAACANTDANQTTPPVVLGMGSSVTPVYQDPQLTLYEVQVPVPLPVRKPTDAELSGLGGAVGPYPSHPFILASDESVEVHYTITNLDDQRHAVYLLLDPWNEFVRYRPGVQVVNDEKTVPNQSGIQNPILVDGKTRVEGTITTDDATALAIGLATCMAVNQANTMMMMTMPMGMMMGMGAGTLMNHAFDPQNRPIQNDLLLKQYVPTVIAGLTGFDLGLRTTEAMNVAVEIQVDVTDNQGDRIVPAGQPGEKIGLPPMVLSPPGARF
jgi:hypothetical protein